MRDETRWLRLRLDLQSVLIRDSERRFAQAAIQTLDCITTTAEFESAIDRDPDIYLCTDSRPLGSSATDSPSTSVVEAMRIYLAAIDSVIDMRTELKQEVDGYITFVRDAEIRILSKHAAGSEW